ncbi:MAG: hypothetical protein L6437_16440 [Kiritimatiellae bacterium]|nr:hypothetical protein [Verrucomicrobiota bacterium]MBU4365742.1 hypothetical protein [Verrucomicrobiota bacterium]MCG2661821.1 hypothetical protein [Kiritimatiellia bacterium]
MKTSMPAMAIRNGKILLPEGQMVSGGLTVERGRIAHIGQPNRTTPALDVKGAYVIPGLIDIHTHGVGRISTSGSPQAYAEQEASHGTTAFYPAFFGMAENDLTLFHRPGLILWRAMGLHRRAPGGRGRSPSI